MEKRKVADGDAVGRAARKELMVDMAAVGEKERGAVFRAADDGEREVEHRQKEEKRRENG